MKAWLCPWSCSTWHSCSEHRPRALQRWEVCGKTLQSCRWNKTSSFPPNPSAHSLSLASALLVQPHHRCLMGLFPADIPCPTKPPAPTGLETFTPRPQRMGPSLAGCIFPFLKLPYCHQSSRNLISNPNIPHTQWAGFSKGCILLITQFPTIPSLGRSTFTLFNCRVFHKVY